MSIFASTERAGTRAFHLLCGVSALTLVCVAGDAAQADCLPDPAADGDDVVCAGTSDGFRDSGFDNGTVTVDGDAIISDSDQGIEVGEGVTIVNDGSVTSTGDHAIETDDDANITNNGDIYATASKDGIHAGKDAIITNNGYIEGGDEGIQADEGSMIINRGTISGGDRGIDADEDDVTVTNAGGIEAVSDGIRVGDYGYVVNKADGLIDAGDDGIQTGADSTAINNGTINAGKEGINANEDGAFVVNNGTIISVDDGINVATGATVINRGDITVTGDQDGIDIDDGTILNTGTIRALGLEDGIDFDYNGTTSSTVTNYGLIEGTHGIYVDNDALDGDGVDNQGQIIINYGTIVGRSGTAIYLGNGDDAVKVGTGSLIDGDIDLGDGTDTFEILAPVAGRYEFVSAPETVTLNGYNAIVTSTTIIAVDSSPFTAIDASMAEFGMDFSQALGSAPAADKLVWARGFGGWSAYDAASVTQGFDLYGGGLVVGRNWDHGGQTLGFFAGGAVYDTALDDDIHDTRMISGFAGLRLSRAMSPVLSVSGDVWLGGAEARIESSELASGNGSTTGLIAGFDGGFVYSPAAPFVLEGAAGYTGFFGDSMDLSGLGAEISGLGSHHFHASLEAGTPFALGMATVTPFLRLEANASTDSNLSASALGETIGLAADDLTTGAGIFGGLKIETVADNGASFDARVAVGTDTNDTLSVDGRVGIKIPF